MKNIKEKILNEKEKLVVIVEEDTRIEDLRDLETFKLIQHKLFKNGILVLLENYDENEELNGEYLEWHDNGILCKKGQYKSGKPVGTFTDFYKNGDIWRISKVEEDGTITSEYF